MSKWAYSTEGFDRIVHRVDGIETVTYAIGEGEPLVYFSRRRHLPRLRVGPRAGERVPGLLPLPPELRRKR
jgi:hypothetical protein